MRRIVSRGIGAGLVLCGFVGAGLAKAEPARTTATATPTETVAKDDRAELKRAMEKPALTVGGQTLTVEYLIGALLTSGPGVRASLSDKEKRDELLKQIVNMELLAAEARRRGYLEQNEIKLAYKNQLASLMHRQLSEEISNAEPTEEELRAYYNENLAKYLKPERMRARHIMITNEKKAAQLLENVAGRKPSQHEFKRLAQENSEDESTRLRGGDLTFFPRPKDRVESDPQVEPEVAEAAFEIEENGGIHPRLVKSAKGYHVIMRTGYREPLSLSFEQARDRIMVLVRRANQKNRLEDAITALKGRYPVEIYEENLKEVVIDLSAGPPAPEAAGALTPTERKRREKKLLKAGEIDKQVEDIKKRIVE